MSWALVVIKVHILLRSERSTSDEIIAVCPWLVSGWAARTGKNVRLAILGEMSQTLEQAGDLQKRSRAKHGEDWRSCLFGLGS